MKSPEVREQMSAALTAISGSLTPAVPDQIIMIIERLSTHHPQPERDDAAWKMWAQDWIEDLSGTPADVLEAVCAEWRRNAKPFMPKSGELIRMINPILQFRRAMLERGERVMKEAETETHGQA